MVEDNLNRYDDNSKIYFSDEMIDKLIRSSQYKEHPKVYRSSAILSPLYYALMVALFIFSFFLIKNAVHNKELQHRSPKETVPSKSDANKNVHKDSTNGGGIY